MNEHKHQSSTPVLSRVNRRAKTIDGSPISLVSNWVNLGKSPGFSELFSPFYKYIEAELKL